MGGRGTTQFSIKTCAYAADALNRTTSANCGGAWAQTFSYDAFGNVFKAGSSSYSPSSYNAQTNQPVSGVKASYDANGNETMTTLVASMSYDANHNAVAAGSTGLTYDAFGRLVEFGGKAVVYGPSGEKLGVFNGTTNTMAFLLPGGSEALYTTGALTSLRRKDWLGSSRVSTSWTHAVVSKAAYAPFGESYATSGTGDLDFTGQTQDSVSTLYDFPARKYDYISGRWTSPDPGAWSVVDPTNPQSFNRYAYVMNMPLRATDPTGLECVWDDGSYDSADDPGTGDVSQCSDQGGRYVPPSTFENSLLTDGSTSGGYGSWSGDKSDTVLSSFFTVASTTSTAVTGPVDVQALSAAIFPLTGALTGLLPAAIGWTSSTGYVYPNMAMPMMSAAPKPRNSSQREIFNTCVATALLDNGTGPMSFDNIDANPTIHTTYQEEYIITRSGKFGGFSSSEETMPVSDPGVGNALGASAAVFGSFNQCFGLLSK